MSNKIVVVGSCMIDFVSYTPKLPKEGETVSGTKFATAFGGKGANQCVAAAKLGGNTSLIARLGNDTWGGNYLKALADLHVDTQHAELIPDISSGIAQIVVDTTGQNQIVIVPGANLELTAKDVENADKLLKEAAVVVCQLETKCEVALKTLELCKGVSILNGAPGIKNANCRLFKLPTIFCVNETEASLFTDLEVETIPEAEKAVADLLKRGCNTVILTLGSKGAVFATKDEPTPIHVETPKLTAVDSTGAGDAFIGALAYLIADHPEFSLKKRIEIACSLAAYSVTKPGTQDSFPDKSILQTYLK